MYMNGTRRVFGLLASVGVASIAAPASAQDQAAIQDAVQDQSVQQDEAPQDYVSEPGIGDIVVTATKRSESINRVGLAIAAVSGDDLRAQGITNVADLTKVVPGLTFARSAFNTPVFTLRGVGYFDSALSGAPAVSVYMDQVPYSYTALTSLAVGLDVERVEVLKGPQGILFGQNSTGGAINYIANKPTDRLETGLDFEYGRFNQIEATAFISGPITNTLRGRVAVKAAYMDGWQQSYYARPGDTLGRRREYVGRILLDWQPTERLNVQFNANGWIDRGQPQAGQFIFFRPNLTSGPDGFGFTPPELIATPLAPNKARAADWTSVIADGSNQNITPRKRDTMWQSSLRADYNLSDDLTLTSITAYAQLKRNGIAGDDGVAINNYDIVANIGKIRDWSQELRLANDAANTIRFTVGGNYQNSKVVERNLLAYGASTASFGVRFSRAGDFSDQRVENWALFGNVDYDVTETLTLKAGARYTNSDRRFIGCTYDNNFDPVWGDDAQRVLFNGIIGALRSSAGLPAAPPLEPGACTLIHAPQTDAAGNPIITPDSYLPGLFDTHLREDNVSWKGGVDFKPSSDTLIYANVTKGYKSGGYPSISASTTNQVRPVTQESVLAYEIGFKQKLFDRTLNLTGAAFYYDYRGKQLKSGFAEPVFGTVFALTNIPKSTIKGAEATLAWQPVDGLNLNGSVTYLDGKIKRFTGINLFGDIGDFAGDMLPYTPKWNVAAGANYSRPLTSDLTLDLGASMAYNSRAQAVIGHDPVTLTVGRLKPFTTVDARIGLSSPDGQWSVQAWVKNLTNEFYWTNVALLYDTTVRYAAMPRTYGIRTSFRF
ncbi:TonB-dependent receptor-like protein [Sphingopyxis fribergensis]|uniref:TonB-dependent receptor-like protein n=1 Tax=Sphingopyxis fribergensis TaxID=1515612 RepID=A0A0A7PHL8_9SPHN|nr:TonB-dependent receptor [Sphingopyxis fribergensis]AJA09500.1 TonB-dependent receptor-like protein [Sphingopyxis fribergensis]